MLARLSTLTALLAMLACGGGSAPIEAKEPTEDSDRGAKKKRNGDDDKKRREQELADEDEREARKRRMRMREREEQEEEVAAKDEEASEPAEPEVDEKAAEEARVRKKAAAEEAREKKKQAAFEARERKKAADAKKSAKRSKQEEADEDEDEDEEEDVADEEPKRSVFRKKAEIEDDEDEEEKPVKKKLSAAQKKKAAEQERRAKKKAQAEEKAAKKKAADEERLAKRKAAEEERLAKKKAEAEEKAAKNKPAKKVVADVDEPDEDEDEDEDEEPARKPEKTVGKTEEEESEDDERKPEVEEEEIEVETASIGPPDPTAESDELDLSSTPTRVEEVVPPPPPTLAIDRRPLTIGKSKLEVHGGLRALAVTSPNGMGGTTSTSTQGLALGATYGFAAKGEVGFDYTLGLNPGSAKGPLQLRGTYLATHNEKLDIAVSLGLMIDFVDSIDPGTMMTTTRTSKGFLVGVWARYHLGAKLSAFSGLPATPSSTGSLSATPALPPIGHQLAIGLSGRDSIGLDLPAGLGYQATPKLYTFLALNLAHLGMSNSDSAVLFSDFIPFALGGFYATSKMDIGAIVADDIKQGTDYLRFDVVVRYSLK